MQTTLLEGVMPLPNDKELVSMLDREATSPLRADALLCLGLEGPAGHVYRVITTNSLWQTIRVFDTLMRQGLVVTQGRSEGGFKFGRVFRPR